MGLTLVYWWRFNVTHFSSERSGGSSFNPTMVDFSTFIFEHDLLDIPLAGGSFTWSSNRELPSWSRIDRYLVSPEWEAHYLDLIRKRLPRLCSDHFPILLDCGGLRGGSRYFKFENMWLKSEGFLDKVRQWWSSYHFYGKPSYVLACKLKSLKKVLKVWNEHVFGDVGGQKNTLFKELKGLEGVEEERELFEEERARKIQVTMDIERVSLLEEISWRQKSRALWLKEGDKCTKFFHRLANSHRRNNAIETLMIDGVTSSNQDEISNHVVKYYENVLSEQFSWRPRLDGLTFDVLGSQEVE
ncbi:uncharacterized protein LOC121253280 [Juglans microcarpa x Juglans regia]|uniref:uncharacterized protein LOC121253280 n=1 Tax=Juglans microcarpa x Juglans regia TaxID=2249226 RepID=UPI001B7E3A39|nr:uncharacterized protein LOC121253280 [Juglans microcarpa x Juglans regia]